MIKIDRKILIFALLSALLVFLSGFVPIIGLGLPILLAIKLCQFDKLSGFIFLVISFILSSLIDLSLSLGLFLPMAIFAYIMAFLIKKDVNDKKTLYILWLILGILSLGLVFYIYQKGLIDIEAMTNYFIRGFENEGLDINEDIIKLSLSTIPAFLLILDLIYALISLKLTRNYLNYKDEKIRDLMPINRLRISIKDFLIILLILILLGIFAYFKGFSIVVIRANVQSFIMSLLQVNGLLLIDFVLERKSSKTMRIINWVLIFFLFALVSRILSAIGLVDLILNLRKKVRRKWKKNLNF